MANPRGRAGILVRSARVAIGLLWTSSPPAVLSVIGLALLAGVVPTGSALLNRAVVNELVAHRMHSDHVITLAVLLGCLGVVVAGAPHGRRFAEGQLRREAGLLIQDRIYRAINGFPGLSRFEEPAFLDQIRLAQQVGNSVVSSLVSATTTCAQSLVTSIGMLLVLASINPVLAAIVAITVLPAVLVQLRNSRSKSELVWRKSPGMRRQLFYGRLMGDANAAKEVRLFGLGDFLRGRMLAELRSVNQGQRALDRQVCTAEGALAVLAAVVSAGGFVWVVGQAAAGRLSIGDVMMFAMAVVGVQNAIGGLIAMLADLYQSLLQFDHYATVVAAGPDLPVADPPRSLPLLRTGIQFHNVWFRYDETHPWVLRGIDLTIPSGASVALIGRNGAGKSTLVKLLCRFYDPQRGHISWDGVDIRDVDPEQLRHRIGTVFQDYVSYDLTAAENVGIGDLGRLADRDRVRQAATEAGVHAKLAALPQGYDTMLSRMFFSAQDKANPHTGVLLSGGEWQRLALARGLMRAERDLLILDEPSSGLDAEAEHAIHQRLCTLRPGRTSLLISHRLGSVRDADTIVVLSGGRITETGTHDELMAAAGEYHRLFTLQASGYRSEPGVDPVRARP